MIGSSEIHGGVYIRGDVSIDPGFRDLITASVVRDRFGYSPSASKRRPELANNVRSQITTPVIHIIHRTKINHGVEVVIYVEAISVAVRKDNMGCRGVDVAVCPTDPDIVATGQIDQRLVRVRRRVGLYERVFYHNILESSKIEHGAADLRTSSDE